MIKRCYNLFSMKEQGSKYGGYIDRIPILSRIKREFDRDIGEMGVQQAFAKKVAIAGEGKLSIRGKDDRVKEILREKPTVVVGNHPSFAEILTTVASLEPRDDMYGIGISLFLGIGPNISKHVFPVYRTKQMSSERQKFLVRAGYLLNLGPNISPEEAHKKNIESVNKAAEAVKDGALVIIFPQGIRSGRERWSRGVGHLLSEIGKNSNGYLIFVYSEGVSSLDYLRLVPGIKKLIPPASVTFAQPRTITSVLEGGGDPRSITERLKVDYRAWIGSLTKD